MQQHIAAMSKSLVHAARAAAALVVGFVVAVPCAQAAAGHGVLDRDLTTPMSVSTAPRAREPREQHTGQHADINETLERAEAHCYLQFAVTSCLSEARAQARADRAVLDERARLDKAARRQATSDAHKRDVALRQAAAESKAAEVTSNGSAPLRNADPASGTRRLVTPSATPRSPGEADNRPRAQRGAGVPVQGQKSASATTSASARTTASASAQRDARAAEQVQRDQRASRDRARLVEKRAAAERHQASMLLQKQARDAKGQGSPAPPTGAAGH